MSGFESYVYYKGIGNDDADFYKASVLLRTYGIDSGE
jgi:hypothetical protein